MLGSYLVIVPFKIGDGLPVPAQRAGEGFRQTGLIIGTWRGSMDHGHGARGLKVKPSSTTYGLQDRGHVTNLSTLPFLHRVVVSVTQEYTKALEDRLAHSKCSIKISSIIITTTTTVGYLGKKQLNGIFGKLEWNLNGKYMSSLSFITTLSNQLGLSSDLRAI